MAAVDWHVNSKDRLSTKYYYQNDPVTLPYDFSQTGGFPVTQNNGSQVVAIDNTIPSTRTSTGSSGWDSSASPPTATSTRR